MFNTLIFNVLTFFFGIDKFLKSNFMRFSYSLLDLLEYHIQVLTATFVLSARAYKNNTSLEPRHLHVGVPLFPIVPVLEIETIIWFFRSVVMQTASFFVLPSCLLMKNSVYCRRPIFFTDTTSSTKAGFGFMQLIWRSPSKALGYIADGSLDCFREIIKG